MNVTRPSGDPTKYDLQQVVEHEIDEVLGCSSGLPNFTLICPIDLFRYTTNLARTYTTNGDNAYFSVDGTNLLARFNMNAGGDYSDFWSVFKTNRWAPPGTTPHSQVQDAFNTPGVVVNYGVSELAMLDVIGWTLSDNAKALLNPPTILVVNPTPGAVFTDSPVQIVSGTAADNTATIASVRVALSRNADGVWFDFVSTNWGTTTFDVSRNILVATGTTSWSAQLPGLPNGNYTVQAQAVDVFNHGSLWKSVAFTLNVAVPVVTFNPLTNTATVFDFAQLGGIISKTAIVKFKIEWFKAGGNFFWNGVNWTSVESEPGVLLAANLAGLNWTPAPGTLPPRLQLAQANYLIHVYATDAGGNVGYNDIVLTRTPLDTTPPIVNLDSNSIHPGDVITNQFLPAVLGLAYDPESGVASLNVYLNQFTSSGILYWNGSSWGSNPAVVPASYNAQTLAWQVTSALPSGANLPNGNYQVQVAAQNNESPAGNRLLSAGFSVDYHPVYVFTAGSYYDSNPNNDNMNWNNPANWDLGSVPTPDARVIINGFSPDNTSLGSLQLYRLDLSGGTLTTSGMLIQKLNVSGGALSAGVITLPANGIFNWSGGIIAGTYNVPAGAMVNLTGSADKTLSYATIANNGTMVWSGGNIIATVLSAITNNASFIIQSSGLFDNNAGGYGGGQPLPTFVNNGWLQKINSNGDTLVTPNYGGWTFYQNGTIDVENGSLSSQAQLFVNSGSIFTGLGETRVTGGSIVINGTSTLQAGGTVELAGGSWSGSNVFTGSGTFVWSGGTMVGTNTVGVGVNLSITGSGIKTLIGKQVNAGNGLWTGAGQVSCSFNSIFENDSTFTIQNDSAFINNASGYGYGLPLPLFVNNGTLVKTNGTNVTVFDFNYGGVAFNNNGTVNVQSGNLALGGGGTAMNSSLIAATGAVVNFNAGAFFFNGSLALLGGGTNRVSGAVVTFNHGTNSMGGGNTYEIASGSVNGTNTFAGAGTVNWSGGTINATLTLQSNIALNISSAADKTLGIGAFLISRGPGTWTGAGQVSCSFNSIFENDSTFTIQNDSAFINNASGYGNGLPLPLFVNNGTFRKNTTTGTTMFNPNYGGVAFNNNGTVDLRSGTLGLYSSNSTTPASQLKIAIGGPASGTQFGTELFSGAAAFDGTLLLSLTNSFTPTNGQSFAIANYTSFTGQFATTQFPPLPVVSQWKLTYGANALLAQVVPSNVFQSSSLTNGNFQFSFRGQTGSSCLIEVSTNLLNWVPLLTNAPFIGTLNYTDLHTLQFTKRFYRATIFP